MPRRSTVLTHLPPRVRKQLERRLIANGFSGYRALTRWLNELGYPLSVSAVHLYGQHFEERYRANELAKTQMRELADTTSNDDLAANTALLRILQQQLFIFLVDSEPELDPKKLARLTRIVTDLSRTAITHHRFVIQTQARLDQLKRNAAARISGMEQTSGLSPEAAAFIRDILMGLDPFTRA